GREAILRGDLQQVRGALLARGGLIAEDALLRFVRQHRVGLRPGPRNVLLLPVREEEQFLPQGADRNRSAEAAPELVLTDARFRNPAALVEERVRVERVVAELLEQLAVILARAAARDELQVRAALRARVGAEAGGFHRDLLHRAEPGGDGCEEARAAALESV